MSGSPEASAPPALVSRSTASELDRRDDLCRSLALAAGAIAREGYHRNDTAGFGMKGPQDFLTETDTAIERYLKAEIARTFPQDGFLGEETGGSLAARLWVVDPIDGTANFARKIPHFCTSIAFVENGQIELGAIYNPCLDELYFARRGRGATRNEQPIHVAATTDHDAACIELGWSNRIPTQDYLTVLAGLLEQGVSIRRGASGALGLAYVADGRSDAYAELHMHPWDSLAGLLLVREAGGVTGPYLERGGLANGGGVLAATPAIAGAVSRATGIPLSEAADFPR